MGHRDARALLDLFPRDCPRMVVWPTAETAPEDRAAWFGDRGCHAIAFVEEDWLGRIRDAVIHRYRLPSDPFEEIGDTGMGVSRVGVAPLGRDTFDDLPGALAAQDVELRSMPRLAPLARLWHTTLHASGIRLRNAKDFPPFQPNDDAEGGRRVPLVEGPGRVVGRAPPR